MPPRSPRAPRDVPLFCRLCRAPVLFASPGTALAALPARRTDGARVLAEAGARARAGALVQTLARAGGAARLRRAGGALEAQHALLCPRCGVRVGYRAAPLGAAAPFTYVHEGALAEEPRDAVAGAGAAREAAAAAEQAAGGAGPGGQEGDREGAVGAARKRAREGGEGGGVMGSAEGGDGGGGGGGGADQSEASAAAGGGTDDGAGGGGDAGSGSGGEVTGAPAARDAGGGFSSAALARRYARVIARGAAAAQ